MFKHVTAGGLALLLAAACGSSGGPGGTSDCVAAGCPGGYACNATSGACEPIPTCATTGCPAGKTCDTTTKLCVAKSCTADSQCGAGQFCLSSLCKGCATGPVLCLSGVPVCNGPADTCVGCGTNADCPAEAPVCAEGMCAQCSASVPCPAGRGTCTWDLRCAPQCDDLTPCPSGQACSPFGTCRAQCAGPANCTSPSAPHCADVGWSYFNRCVACLDDAECTGPGERCVSGDCAVTLAGDACEAPIPLDLAAGEVFLAHDIEGYRHECGSGCIVDVFFAIEAPVESVLDAVVQGEGIDPAVSIELLSGCGVHFADATTTNPTAGTATMAGRVLPPGSYLLRVAVDPYSQTLFTLRARLSPVPIDPGSTCIQAIALVPDAAGKFTRYGNTTGNGQPSPDACDMSGAADAPEEVYYVDLAVPSWLGVTVDATGTNNVQGLAFKQACGSAAYEQQVCPYFAMTRGQTLTSGGGPLPAGRHYIVVTTLDWGYPGPYRLTGTVVPWPTNDACADAEPLAFTADAATTRGQVGHATWEGCAACSVATCTSGPDVFYRLSTTGLGDRSLDLTVTPDSVTTWQPKLVLAPSCAAMPAASWCAVGAAGGVGSLSVDVLPPGDYWLAVSGFNATSFRLDAVQGPPRYPAPENDACFPPAASRLAPADVGLSAMLSGDSRGANDTLSGTCAGDPGLDVVYEVAVPPWYGTIPLAGEVELKVHPTDPAFDPAIVLDATCSAVGGGCTNAAGPGQDETMVALLPTQSWAWVEAAGGTGGRFTISAKLLRRSPYNDIPSGREAIAIDGSTSGTMELATPDLKCLGVTGPNLWYSVWNSAKPDKTVRVTVTPTGFDAALTVHDYFDQPCSQVVNAGGSDQAESVDVPLAFDVVRAFSVISVDGRRGTFTISATRL